METFQREETVVLKAEVKDENGNYVDPAGGVAVTIYDPQGTKQVDGAAMSKTDSGRYRYDFQTSSSTALGIWKARVKAVDGTRITLAGVNFELEG